MEIEVKQTMGGKPKLIMDQDIYVNRIRKKNGEFSDANRFQGLALRTMNHKLFDIEQLQNGLMGLNGEAGEAIDILKKHLFQGHELDKSHIAMELGDCLWYIALTAHALGYTMSDVMEMNVNKLKARYPEGFDSDLSVNRAEGDI